MSQNHQCTYIVPCLLVKLNLFVKVSFETDSTALLAWIRLKTTEIMKREFPNSLDGIQERNTHFEFI